MEQVKITLTPNGITALDRVASWLEAGAPHVLVGEDGRRLDGFDMEYGVAQGECGTSCCIAGAVYQFQELGYAGNYANYWGEVAPLTKDLLVGEKGESSHIDNCRDELSKLFLPWGYYETEEGGRESDYFNDTAKAAQVIRHLLATGYIDWTVAGYFES